MAEILKGKPVADAIKTKLSNEIKKLNVTPTLAIIRVGKNSDDLYYENSIKKTCETVGIQYHLFEYEENVTQESLEENLKEIANDNTIHGMLMFAPLPKHLDEYKIRSLIPPQKDVDCMNPMSAGKIYTGFETAFPPCTAAACMEMLRFYNITIKGKQCVVLGRSLVVGKPVAMLLLKENGTVTIAHSHTQNLPAICQAADILITATGHAKLIDETFVKPHHAIIDVGINPDPNNPGKFCGDVNFDVVEPIVSKISPVPGGTGAITTAILCKHVVMAVKEV